MCVCAFSDVCVCTPSLCLPVIHTPSLGGSGGGWWKLSLEARLSTDRGVSTTSKVCRRSSEDTLRETGRAAGWGGRERGEERGEGERGGRGEGERGGRGEGEGRERGEGERGGRGEGERGGREGRERGEGEGDDYSHQGIGPYDLWF